MIENLTMFFYYVLGKRIIQPEMSWPIVRR